MRFQLNQIVITMNDLFITTLIAIFAYTYRAILAYEPVLNWWFKFGLRYEKKWFYKPIWGCSLCISGQMALWIYILNWSASNFNQNAPFWRFIYFLIPEYNPNDFSLILAGIFISITILQTFLINKLFEKWNLKD